MEYHGWHKRPRKEEELDYASRHRPHHRKHKLRRQKEILPRQRPHRPRHHHRRHEHRRHHHTNSVDHSTKLVAASLPWEITCYIFSRLPIKFLLRLTSVSKTCYLTRDPYFIDMQLTSAIQQPHSFILIESQGLYFQLLDMQNHLCEVKQIPFKPKLQSQVWMQIVATCNGLLCLLESPGYFITIYNPITRESVAVPNPNLERPAGERRFSFGFDDKSNKYKLVIISNIYRLTGNVDHPYRITLVADIITLGESSWRKLDLPYESKLRVYGEYHTGSVFFNGGFYWIMSKPNYPDSADSFILLTMDICDEKFRVIKFIDTCTPNPECYLFGSGKYLTLLETNVQDQGIQVQIWHLVDKEQEIWVHQTSNGSFLKCCGDIKVVGMVGNDSILLALYDKNITDCKGDQTQGGYHLFLYCTRRRKRSSVSLSCGILRCTLMCSFVPSLLSLKI